MKVVLFCGGLGTRLREHSDTIPKPLVGIGYRPIIWHLMRYYAHFGHKDFILCLGYRGNMIREFFLNYREEMYSDFVLSEGGKRIEVLGTEMKDWTITFVDTGLHANIGQRLLKARPFLEQEEIFLANYADGLSDLPLDDQLAKFNERDAVAGLAAVRSPLSFHAVHCDEDGYASQIGEVRESDNLINGGFFVLRREIFNFIEEGEELVEAPFQRLIRQRKLLVYRYPGFWQSMDTLKDKIAFDRMEARGDCPWAVWREKGR